MNRFLFSLISNATDFIHRQTDVYINQHLNTSGWAVLVMEATIGSCDATPTGATLERLMNVLLPLTVDHSKAEVRLSACRLVAALINKLPEGKQKIGISFLFWFSYYIRFAIVRGFELLLSTGKELELWLDSLRQKWQDPLADRANAICLFTWIAKGLLMRSYHNLNSVINEVFK